MNIKILPFLCLNFFFQNVLDSKRMYSSIKKREVKSEKRLNPEENLKQKVPNEITK